MIRHIASALGAGLLLAASMDPALAAPKDLAGARIASVAVVMVDPEGDYTVIDESMDPIGAAGAMFGLVGAVAASARDSRGDAKAAEQWAEVAATLDVGAMVEAAILDTLATRGDVPVATSEAASHRLVVDLQDWGMTRTSQEHDELRAFIKMNVEVVDAKGRTIWKDHPSKRGKLSTANRAAITDDVFRDEMTKLAEKAGKGVAYELIYR